MIRLNQKITPNEGGRKATETGPMTPQQIQSEALSVMAQGLSQKAWHALDLLFAGGIMTVDQIGLTSRTLRRYGAKRVVDRYAIAPSFVAQELGNYGLDVENGQLYTLGPVGARIAEMRYGIKPPSGFLAYPLERVLHDVIVNEIVLRIAHEADAHGWQITWASKYQSSIFRDDVPLLEPDAYICLEQGDRVHPLLIEYHNEERRTRALQKVRQYERAWESDLWQEAWEVEEFPPLLAVFRKEIVGEGYLDGLKENAPVDVAYYGRSLSSLLAEGGLKDWFHINTKKKGNIFPWYLGE